MHKSFLTSKLSTQFFSLVLFLLSFSLVQADALKPFVLADAATGDFAKTVTDTKAKLTSAGFKVVGEYTPYTGASIIIVTNDALKANAKETKFGGYGAAQRVAITDKNGTVQVTYTNPSYMAAVYRMKGDLASVSAALKKALGEQKAYGVKKGLSKKDLGGYHYMFGMPYFDEPDMLADHGSYEKAMKMAKTALAAKKGGVSKVFEITLPGKKQTIIGVAMTDGDSSDATIMKEVDFQDISSTAHLPYEMLIDEDGKVYALSAKFRIAINFPDLSMSGDHSFMGIMGAPDAIKAALSKAAGASEEKSGSKSDFDF